MEKLSVKTRRTETAALSAGSAHGSGPWWRYKMVWLVIGGPLVVVVASITTAVVAIRGADPVMSKEEMEASVQGQRQSLVPAVQARNHAAAPK